MRKHEKVKCVAVKRNYDVIKTYEATEMSIDCKDIFMQGGRANGSAAEHEI